MALNSRRRRAARLLLALLGTIALLAILLIWITLLIQSGTRAFSSGENLWSRGYQNALFFADRYAEAGAPEDLRQALRFLSVPLGHYQGRRALEQNPPDLERARQSLQAGGISESDIELLIWTHRYFSRLPFISETLRNWRASDTRLMQLQQLIEDVVHARGQTELDAELIARQRAELRTISESLGPAPSPFAGSLRQGERALRSALIAASTLAMLMLVLLSWRLSRRLLEALHAAEGKFHTAFEQAAIGMAEVGPDGHFIEVNEALCRMLRYDREDLLGTPLQRYTHAEDIDSSNQALKRLTSGVSRSETYDKRYISRDGETLWTRLTVSSVRDGDGDRLRLFSIVEDITHARKLSDELSYRASHDGLTGLWNRQEFELRLQQAVQDARTNDSQHTLAFIDLDQFKVVNDTCGHIAGDHMLCQVAQVLRNHLRDHDLLARLGGDEFAVLLHDTTGDGARLAAGKLHQAIKDYCFHWQGRNFSLSSSIGLATINGNSHDSTSVLQAADTACNMAKDSGRSRIHFYLERDSATEHRRREMEWVSGIRDALDNARLSLFAQRIRALDGDRPERFEVLVRLTDAEGIEHPPGAFMPAAERYNLIGEIDRFVLTRTLQLLARQQDRLARIDACHINVSARSIACPEFRAEVTRTLRQSALKGPRICFEITETAAVTSLHDALEFIASVRELGCQVSLDDFGSGLSSFGYLKNLPVDLLKIDGNFVRRVHESPEDKAIVQAINHAAQALQKATVAEFVEHGDAIEVLREIGVDYVQGYAVHRPEPLEQLLARSGSGAMPPSSDRLATTSGH
ncbi:GGDEF domain-containing protein [Marinobacterium nitratireducens]|uniref:GGDEF domain-containing protein n=1 Tax=Marinobacterium nitratireducens TaxID=518897 RepID=A0A918DRM8_9GAMM|nr:EAL domain-containing protein [Marinobacterium nitratireducens]GGO81312.1 GGDEF domain-containing protein [Marinobacterium nitratireducens]